MESGPFDFHSQAIGPKSGPWPQLTALEAGKCGSSNRTALFAVKERKRGFRVDNDQAVRHLFQASTVINSLGKRQSEQRCI